MASCRQSRPRDATRALVIHRAFASDPDRAAEALARLLASRLKPAEPEQQARETSEAA